MMIRLKSASALRAGASIGGLAVVLLAVGSSHAGAQAKAASAKKKSAAIPAVASAPRPSATYWVYVGAESADLIHRIQFGPGGAKLEKTIGAGEIPTENEGPHGLIISADRKFLHMTTGHGNPDGKYWKYELGPDTVVGVPSPLGNFPASLDVSSDGLYAFIANFNLHGEMTPSSVSVIFTPTNTEVARTTTCTMPHGSRIDASGSRQYSTCMMDDQLVELDTRTFDVSRRFSLAKGKEGPIAVAASAEHAGHDMGKMAPASCSPTWAQPSAKSGKVYVACNKADEILEIDAASWTISRRLPTGRGPYNLAVTPDGRLLVATLKQGHAVQLFDVATGKSLMVEKTSTTLAHGVAVSSDSRYAFVTSEGVGSAPGKVDVFDLTARRKVGTVDVGQQAAGIAFWKMEGK